MVEQKRPTLRLGSLVGIVLTVLFGLVIYSQKQAIYDYSRLYNYDAPADVVALADDTTMTDDARRIFYINRPELQDKTAFNQSCPDNGGEQTIVLGCYQSPQVGIYLLKVSDPQLKGVEEVTAAHEMLHGAYDRLSDKERQRVDGLLLEYYETLQDERLLSIFEAYRATDPSSLPNEMHSIFPTEIAQLPPALEDYYRQYFQDRQKVVGFASQYQGAFNSRKTLIVSYDEQLQTLKTAIEAGQNSLEAQSEAIVQQRQQLNALLANGNTQAYNSQVENFNARVQAYNSGLNQVKAQIADYNVLVEKRNAVAVETQNLSQQLDSSFLQSEPAQ